MRCLQPTPGYQSSSAPCHQTHDCKCEHKVFWESKKLTPSQGKNRIKFKYYIIPTMNNNMNVGVVLVFLHSSFCDVFLSFNNVFISLFGKFQTNEVNTMPADALAHCISWSSGSWNSLQVIMHFLLMSIHFKHPCISMLRNYINTNSTYGCFF